MNSLNREELARQIWHAGVAAVDARQLVRHSLRIDAGALWVGPRSYPLATLGRVEIVGTGKAGAGMVRGALDLLAPALPPGQLSGWVNVPADCVGLTPPVVLHPARPAGLNEPTAAGVAGATEILARVARLGPRDLCLVLLSGGGSALLPAPAPGLSLADKQAVTRVLMQSGATIHELNTVRKQLSAIKGGGLARAIRAGHTETLIISDVVGDPLDIIASGPTVPDTGSPAAALAVLDRLGVRPPAIPPHVFTWLQQKAVDQPTSPAPTTTLHNTLIGRNQTALAASAAAATAAGCDVLDLGSNNTGEATEVGQALARLAREQQASRGPNRPPLCLLSGGEPVVRLPPASDRGLGGRNQQLALAALIEWYFATEDFPAANSATPAPVLLSGGTDGEDGPTDAAGALATLEIARRARDLQLDPHQFLRRCDAWHFFDRCGGLLKTGPTHTNVMDLRVVIV